MVVYCVCHVSIEEESRAHRHGSYRILLRFGSSFFSPPRIERRFEKGILAGNKFTRYSQHVADIIWSQSKIVVVEGTFQCDRLSAAQFQRKRTLGLRRENSYGSHSLTHSLAPNHFKRRQHRQQRLCRPSTPSRGIQWPAKVITIESHRGTQQQTVK
jgi:hypothetical protein